MLFAGSSTTNDNTNIAPSHPSTLPAALHPSTLPAAGNHSLITQINIILGSDYQNLNDIGEYKLKDAILFINSDCTKIANIILPNISNGIGIEHINSINVNDADVTNRLNELQRLQSIKSQIVNLLHSRGVKLSVGTSKTSVILGTLRYQNI